MRTPAADSRFQFTTPNPKDGEGYGIDGRPTVPVRCPSLLQSYRLYQSTQVHLPGTPRATSSTWTGRLRSRTDPLRHTDERIAKDLTAWRRPAARVTGRHRHPDALLQFPGPRPVRRLA